MIRTSAVPVTRTGVAFSGGVEFPVDFPRTVRLRDGRPVEVGLLTPADAAELGAALRAADAETLRRRFCGPPPRVTPRLLRYLTELDYVRRFALVTREPGGRGVGIARYEATDEPGVAEVAVVVDRAWRRLGGASALVRMLGEAAAQRGFTRFTATYLAANRPVAELLDDVGAKQVIADGIGEMELALPAATSDRKARSGRLSPVGPGCKLDGRGDHR
ncbi:GNAT family N-acetyltransferase [Amycolatopsis cihanbeyliensis]|uniref:RimJ/RimL family protein N-acetyltransferase n=1 Tax=Amycolatopsis cihanbeyliensis TaxID=1128664 RepID=A0A542CTB1_AMYCI|nr:GNAT family N-acetyltransferase [Amycolatopsis cihanbeyliensis]TQI94062.1 RimJ/RimL family protein N-acetyltransferase [Amycolatopsis cihanbeyliensis]